MEGFGDATLSRTRSARLSEYRRKYSDALASSSPPSGSASRPITLNPTSRGRLRLVLINVLEILI